MFFRICPEDGQINRNFGKKSFFHGYSESVRFRRIVDRCMYGIDRYIEKERN